MRSPFPGMNPYLDHHVLWHEVHTRLMVALADYLNPLVSPRYYAAVEQRTYVALAIGDDLAGLPDVTIVESAPFPLLPTSAPRGAPAAPLRAQVPIRTEEIQRYLEVRELRTEALITTIELLSYSNKHAGRARRDYENKRAQILASETHLVEIDLLRAEKPMPMRLESGTRHSDYRILVSRAETRPDAEVYLFDVRDAIPLFHLPLQEDDTEPLVDLVEALHQVYERGSYDRRVDYERSPEPPLRGVDAKWAYELLRQHNLRGA